VDSFIPEVKDIVPVLILEAIHQSSGGCEVINDLHVGGGRPSW
jgi:hypothetical protein